MRNRILDWALVMKKSGISGVDRDFTAREKDAAAMLGPSLVIIGNQNALAAGGSVASVRVADNDSCRQEIGKLLDRIEGNIEEFKRLEFDVARIDDVVKQFRLEINKDNQDGAKLINLVGSLRDVGTGAAGNIVADGFFAIIDKISSLVTGMSG